MIDEKTLYARFISGELTPEEEEQLNQNGDREKLEKIIAMTDRFRMPEVDKETGFKKLVTSKKNSNPTKVFKMAPYIRWISGIAAVLLVAWGLFLFSGNDIIQLQATYASTINHHFEDGSTMVLNAGAQASYDKTNWGTSRSVKLDGEAFFDVKPGEPFAVVTDYGTVEVLGTKFNVRSYDNRFSVECYEGKVKVSVDTIHRIIKAQEGIQVRNTTQLDEYTLVKVLPDWQRGRSIFRNASIQEVLQELERQFDITVQSDISDMNFRGSFNNSDLDTAINEIAQPLGIKATISTDRKTVTFIR